MKKHLLIALGGMLGALVRTALERAFPWDASTGLPYQTLLINVTGGFLLTLLLTAVLEKWEMDSDLRHGLSTGFLAAFTTFSTFSMETGELILAGRFGAALLYLMASLTLGLLAAWGGMVSARRIVQ